MDSDVTTDFRCQSYWKSPQPKKDLSFFKKWTVFSHEEFHKKFQTVEIGFPGINSVERRKKI